VLRELEGLETGEVARALQISSITVRRHLFQARRRLQASLRGEEERAVVIERIARDPSSHG
jgi:DNA-directed RNA polymerase specialized sigma24 family protein